MKQAPRSNRFVAEIIELSEFRKPSARAAYYYFSVRRPP